MPQTRSGTGFGSPFPKPPKAPRKPARLPKLGKIRGAPKLEPFKAPVVPMPQELEKNREEAWRAWQAKEPGKGSASILEFICWDFLVHQKNQIQDVDFYYQYPLAGGRTSFGGFVTDFYLINRKLAWNPAGLQFHYTNPSDRARDNISKVLLAARGITEIFLYEDDLLQRTQYTLEHAWNGEQVSRIQLPA